VAEPELGIVIPAYNEALTIGQVVKSVRETGIAIVVNDNSLDETSEIAKKAGAVVVNHATNLGYDQALESGFRYAADHGFKYIATIDADGQHDATLLPEILSMLSSGISIVIGSRDKKQRFSEYLFAWLTKYLYGVDDPLCGMKAYNTNVYKHLGHFDSYQSIGTELALFGIRSGFSFEQIPIVTQERGDSSRFGSFLHANYRILRALVFSFLKIHPLILNADKTVD
jgi:glycosyltransferase involved in cell wall biosynthesis